MTAPPRLLCLGNLTVDDVYLPDGSQRLGCVGGDALYATLAARLWEPRTAMLAPVGTDLPDAARAALRTAGVDVTGLPRRAAPTIHNEVHYAADGNRRWVLEAGMDDFEELSVKPSDFPAWALQAEVILSSAMTLAAQEACIRDLRHRSSATLALDLQENYVPGNEQRILDLARLVDIFLPSEDEVRMLTGSEDWEQVARELARLGPEIVGIKFAARGSLIYERSRDALIRIPAWPTRVVDTTGAGDAYCGGLLAMFATDRTDLARAAIAGAVSAAFAVSGYGTDGLTSATPQHAKRSLKSAKGQLARG